MSATAFGLEVSELPDGSIPLEAVCIVKLLDDSGEASLVIRTTSGLNDWERVGMLDGALDVAKADVSESWALEDDDQEDDDGS